MTTATSYKQRTMRLLKISESEYKKRYDVYLKRVRNYERASGLTTKRDASRLFYYTNKAIQKGENLSIERQAILNTTAVTTTARLSERQIKIAKDAFYSQTQNFINNNTKAKEIWENPDLTDKEKMQKIRKGLDRLEGQRKVLRGENGEYEDISTAYNEGEVYGSDGEDLFE